LSASLLQLEVLLKLIVKREMFSLQACGIGILGVVGPGQPNLADSKCREPICEFAESRDMVAVGMGGYDYLDFLAGHGLDVVHDEAHRAYFTVHVRAEVEEHVFCVGSGIER
jgi:hypothetical protein